MNRHIKKRIIVTHSITVYALQCNGIISLALYRSIKEHLLYWILAIVSIIIDLVLSKSFLRDHKPTISKKESLTYWLIITILIVLDVVFVYLLFHLFDAKSLLFVRIITTVILGLYLFERIIVYNMFAIN